MWKFVTFIRWYVSRLDVMYNHDLNGKLYAELITDSAKTRTYKISRLHLSMWVLFLIS